MKIKNCVINVLIISLIVVLTGCTDTNVNTSQNTQSDLAFSIPTAEPIPEPTATPTPSPTPAFEEYDIKLMAVGDNLMHMGIVNSGRMPDGTYNYDFLYENISDFIDEADISIINQETIFGGNELGFSGYPHFNSPTEVGDAIVKAGFNVVLQATNHTADQGINGIHNAIEYWAMHPEILMVGMHEKTEGEKVIPIMEIKDIKFAILNYTYGPNMESFPKGLEGLFDILCDYDASSRMIDFKKINPAVIDDIKRAKTMADVVVVCPHWGTEYALKPSTYQIEFAKQMTEAGADLIIGAHPHVPEPVEYVTSDNGNTSLCFYSLGNYVSTQQDKESMLEGLAWVTFHVTSDGVSIDKDKSGSIPIICQYLSGPLRFQGVYTLEEYTEELAVSHGIKNWGGVTLHLEDMQNLSKQIFGDYELPVARAFE